MNTEKTLQWNGNIVGYETTIDSQYSEIRTTEKSSGIVRYIKSNKTELCYHAETSKQIIELLDRYFLSRERLVFDFGDTRTGESWGEIHDISGRIGRSTGVIKIPLLVYNERSYGGGGLLDNCIVKISTAKGKRVIYQHQNYTATKNN